MCDAPLEDGSGRKRVVAFVGGLDITNGRYDDPTFPLWSTIPTVHSRGAIQWSYNEASPHNRYRLHKNIPSLYMQYDLMIQF